MEPTGPEHELGLALYRLRLESGLSLRALAKVMGYSAHSVFADVEKARRLPSESLTRSYEERFGLPPNSLLALRRRVLRERAARLTDRFASSPAFPDSPSADPTSPASPEESPACPSSYLVGSVRCRAAGLRAAGQKDAEGYPAWGRGVLVGLSVWLVIVGWRRGWGPAGRPHR